VREPTDLADVAASAFASWRASARFARHRVELETAPAWVEADPTRLEQVLGNLLANALKYTPSGGLITVRVRAEGESAVLEVQDTGAGIPPELLSKVFDLFVQGERTLDRSQGGLGIGLTLTRALVEIHGGTVERTATARGTGPPSRSGCRGFPRRRRPRPRRSRRRRPRRRRVSHAGSCSSRTTPTRARCCVRSWRRTATRFTRRPTARPASTWRPPSGPTWSSSTSGCPASTVTRWRAASAPPSGGRSMLLVALTGYGRPTTAAVPSTPAATARPPSRCSPSASRDPRVRAPGLGRRALLRIEPEGCAKHRATLLDLRPLAPADEAAVPTSA
jgi:hypothetical protein